MEKNDFQEIIKEYADFFPYKNIRMGCRLNAGKSSASS